MTARAASNEESQAGGPEPVGGGFGGLGAWTWLLIAFGAALRLFHYLRDPSVWHDEAALILNVIARPFAELLGALTFAEAAPPLFLFLERVVALALGDSTYALRLPPLVASLAALPLLVSVGRRCLAPAALPWAVLLLACSDRLLWHSCEAKPYALDVLAALALPALFLGTASWRLLPRLLLLAAAAPLVVLTCYPGGFLCGGLLVALLPELYQAVIRGPGPAARRGEALFGYTLLTAAVFVSFAWLVTGPVAAQRCPEMDRCWLSAFPPRDDPGAVPGWVVRATLGVCDYCQRPVGGALALLGVVGAVRLWGRGRRALLALLVIPVLLAFLAAWLRAYPFMGARVLVYATPAFTLLVAEGVPPAFGWLRRQIRLGLGQRPGWGARARVAFGAVGLAALVGLLVTPAVNALAGLEDPWGRPAFDRAADYVLDGLRPGDVIVGNAWETLYYFRRQEVGLWGWVGPDWRPGARKWVVVGGKVPAAERVDIAEGISPGRRHTLDRREFRDVTVLLRSADEDARPDAKGGAAWRASTD